jgi:hypothetical protein
MKGRRLPGSGQTDLAGQAEERRDSERRVRAAGCAVPLGHTENPKRGAGMPQGTTAVFVPRFQPSRSLVGLPDEA